MALSQKSATDMEANNQRWETQEKKLTIKVSLIEEQLHQRDLEIIRLTEDNNRLVKKLAETTEEVTSRDAELLQRDAEIIRLTEDNNSIILKLSETAEELRGRDAELLQSQTAWEDKLQSLRDKFYNLVEIQQRLEAQQTKSRVKVEAEIGQRDAEIIRLTQDNNSLVHKLSKTAEERRVRDAELLQSQTAWEDKLQSLRNNFCNLEESQQSMKAQHTQFSFKLEAKISQRDADIIRLTEDNNCLVHKLSATAEELRSKDAELLQSQTSWHDKYIALEKVTEDLAEKQQSWEAQHTQFRVKMEPEISQRDAEILRLTEDNNCLSLKLSKTAEKLRRKDAELLQSQTSWQDKLQSLRDKFYNLVEIQQSWEAQQTQSRVKVESDISQRDAEIIRLTEDNNSLNNKLSKTAEELRGKDVQLLQSQTAWHDKYAALEKVTEDLAEKQQSWEPQQTHSRVKVEPDISQRDAEILRLTEDNNSLNNKLSKTAEELRVKDAQLLQSQTACHDKYTALEKVTKDLAEKQQSLETEVTQLVADKAELEDLCLYINKKRRRFLLFPRRSSDDRETQLQKLKIKMQQKAAKTRGDEMEEEMEAGDC
ncbi:hypothetical protein ABVT39_002628 [Epinephelus coioides]